MPAPIGVTVLTLLYPQLPVARIVGSDIAHAVPLTFVAGLGHWMIGSVDVHILGSLLLGSVPGIALGSYAALRVPDRPLRWALAIVLTIAGGKLLIQLASLVDGGPEAAQRRLSSSAPPSPGSGQEPLPCAVQPRG